MSTQIKKKDIVLLIAMFLVLIVVLVFVLGIMPSRNKIKEAEVKKKAYLTEANQVKVKNIEEVKKYNTVKNEYDEIAKLANQKLDELNALQENSKASYSTEDKLNAKIRAIIESHGFAWTSTDIVRPENNMITGYTKYTFDYGDKYGAHGQPKYNLGYTIKKPINDPDNPDLNFATKIAFFNQLVQNVDPGVNEYLYLKDDYTSTIYQKNIGEAEYSAGGNDVKNYIYKNFKSQFGSPKTRVMNLVNELKNMKGGEHDDKQMSIVVREFKFELTNVSAPWTFSKEKDDTTELLVERNEGKFGFKMEILVKNE